MCRGRSSASPTTNRASHARRRCTARTTTIRPPTPTGATGATREPRSTRVRRRSHMDHTVRKLFVGTATVALALSSVGTVLAQDESAAPDASAAAGGSYVLGVSNTVQGNGWREEMICSIKAQALASGKVASLNIAHRNTDAGGPARGHPQPDRRRRRRHRRQPGRPRRRSTTRSRRPPAPASRSSPSTRPSPSRRPTSSRTTRRPTPTSAPSGCSSRWAARAPSSTCAALPAHPPTTTVTRASRRRSPSSPTSTLPRRSSPAGSRTRASSRSSTYIATGIPFDGVWTSGIDNVIVDALVEEGVDDAHRRC